MGQTRKVSKNNTTVRTVDGETIVTLYGTEIVKFNAKQITLNHGGYITATTANRMNQVANEFGLPFRVCRKAGTMFVSSTYRGRCQTTELDADGIKIDR